MLALAFAALLAEQVTVTGARGLAGLWQVQIPQSVAVRGLFRAIEFGPMRTVFCRIGEDLSIHCFHGGYAREGTVALDGDAAHIAWGTAMARFVIDGKPQGDAITGTFTFKFSGISRDAPAPSQSRRIRASAHDEASELRARLPSVPALNGLGAIQHIAFLGRRPSWMAEAIRISTASMPSNLQAASASAACRAARQNRCPASDRGAIYGAYQGFSPRGHSSDFRLIRLSA